MNSRAEYLNGNDTISQEEIFVSSLHNIKTIADLLERLSNYYYIYGTDRSNFTSSWSGHLRDAAIRDCPEGDRADLSMFVSEGLVPVGEYFWSKRVIKEMLKDAAEYSAYDFLDKEGLTEALCKQMQIAYTSHKKKQFKAKLAGEDNVYYGW